MNNSVISDCLAMINGSNMPTVVDFRSYSNFANAMPIYTDEQEKALAQEYKDNQNQDARKAVVLSLLRQVVKIVSLYRGYGLPDLDLVQEGNVGLLKAVDRFDAKKGVKLSTYATYWIKATIHEYIIRNWKIVKVATTNAQRKLFFKFRSVTQKIGHRLGIEEVKEVAKKLDVTEKDVIEMEKRLTNHDVPFEKEVTANSAIDEDFDNSPSATLVSEEAINPEDILIETNTEKLQKEKLNEAINKLNDREKYILSARYYQADNEKAKTFLELSKELNISAERVRQVEEKAMTKIKTYMQACLPNLT